MSEKSPRTIDPATIAPRLGTSYPEQFKSGSEKRIKRVVGDALGLTQYGVNIVTLPPGAESALRHWHTEEDEFVYIINGTLTLVTDHGNETLSAGMTAGFPGGEENGHHLINESDQDASYLEVGTRGSRDEVFYPGKDLAVRRTEDGRGFFNLKGEPVE